MLNQETPDILGMGIQTDVYEMGIQARNENKSVFDYPFDISDPDTDIWIDGFMFRDKELRNV